MEVNAHSAQNIPPTLQQRIVSLGLVSGEELMVAIEGVDESDPIAVGQVLVEKSCLTLFQLAALNEDRDAALRIGNYDILDRLGAGGMGTVFKARHRRMKRIVALKLLTPTLSKNPLFVKRFQREAETIACLGHPNVVMAYDADEAEAGHFLVMEFVNGVDLAACVERAGPFSLGRAVDCTLQAARGLAYSHAQGIIHRDVKPHNLLYDHNGVVKITDLGLARLNHGPGGPTPGTDVTMAGGVIGTADYMPPEQAFDATAIDHRADIYSLGCTLYYLIAGRPPFTGSTLMSILLKHRDGEIPSLSSLRPDAPESLDQLFCRMLAKRADQRVSKMADVVLELEAIAQQCPPASDSGFGPAAVVAGIPSKPPWTTAKTDQALTGMTMELASVPQPISVLIVEPSRVQAAIISSLVKSLSMSVAGVVNCGLAAIAAIHELRPRAVISAMYLKDSDGVSLAHRIRAEITANAPGFVLITTEADEAGIGSLSQVNRVITLRKPFTAEQLSVVLSVVASSSMSIDFSDGVPGVDLAKLARQDRSLKKVMIVDDSSTARMNVRKTLIELGFSQFVEVPDGAYAIGIAHHESCDLIITDYNMPLMDGRALISYLKQSPRTAAIPIIMVTTETEASILDPVHQLGVMAIVEKGFPANVIVPLMNKLFPT